jgi:hypothetical protein
MSDNPLKMVVKMLTHLHIVVYTWWCWHICKGEEVGVEKNQLGEEKGCHCGDRTLLQHAPDANAIVTDANGTVTRH